MKPELDAALVRDFPLLYAEPSRGRVRRTPKREAARPFGFECGDGWEPLIRRLSEKLEALLRQVPAEIRLRDSLRCFWAKEKFGGLRFDLVGYPEDENLRKTIGELIGEAVRESYRTCEACGKPGSVSSNRPKTSDRHFWIQTLCEEHHRMREAADTGYKVQDSKETLG